MQRLAGHSKVGIYRSMGILSFVDFQVLTRDARGKFGRVLSSIHTDVLSGRTFSVLGTFHYFRASPDSSFFPL